MSGLELFLIGLVLGMVMALIFTGGRSGGGGHHHYY